MSKVLLHKHTIFFPKFVRLIGRMMKFSRHIFILLLVLCAFSCIRKKDGNVSVIPLTLKVLKDTSSAAYKNISSFNPGDSRGTIAIVGAPEDVMRVGEQLLSCDRRDNISGTSRPDGLPDFAGETFAEILDFANYPYGEYIALQNGDFLREINVRNFLDAIDTACLQSPYDTTSGLYRQRSKAVIFASSYSSAYGHHDIDSMLVGTGSALPVLTPVHSMVEYAFGQQKGPVNLLIWSDKSKVDNDLYAPVIPQMLAAHGEGSSYKVLVPYRDSLAEDDGLREELLDMLDTYMSSESKKIDAILLDDGEVSLDELSSIVEAIVSTDDDELLPYRSVLSENVLCISPALAFSEQLYTYLRKYNAFTHKIAYPDLQFYITYPSVDLPEDVYDVDGGFSFAYKYSRKMDPDTSTFSLVKLRDRYFPDVMEEFMEKNAPKSYSIYVR